MIRLCPHSCIKLSVSWRRQLYDVAFAFGTATLSEAGFKRSRVSTDHHHYQRLGNDRRQHSHPVFLETSQNVSVGPGDRAVLRCRVENLGTKTVC